MNEKFFRKGPLNAAKNRPSLPSEAELAAEAEFERVARIATLRARREKECFTIINRGQMWYEMLDEMQKQDLRDWYRQWLDVTVTQVVPNKPYWLKD